MKRLSSFFRQRLNIGICLCIIGQVALGEPPADKLRIETQTIATGSAKWDWRQARTDLLPGDEAAALTVMSQTAPVGAHGYHDVFLNMSRDHGRTWTIPEAIPTLKRARLPDGSDRVAGDLWPIKHPQTKTMLLVGKVFIFENGKKENTLREEVAYAVYDPASQTCGPLLTLKLPATDHAGHPFTAANAGCNQPVSLKNGEILLPIRYQKDPQKRIYTSTVTRCKFDGKLLTCLEQGSEHTLMSGRGLYEPSLGEFGGRYFLTLRADDGAYVARSEDGLKFDSHRPWTFDDGQTLGSKNTQQHWITVGGKLYLIYTRRGADNDHVFRFRAPLFIGQVDPDRLCVIRATEQIVFPNDGGLYGNSGICHVSENEAWITCAEDGEKKKHVSQIGNEVLLARIYASGQD